MQDIEQLTDEQIAEAEGAEVDTMTMTWGQPDRRERTPEWQQYTATLKGGKRVRVDKATYERIRRR